MNIRQVLPVGAIIIIGTFRISNILSQSSIRTLEESAEWVAHTYQVKGLLKGLEKTLVDAETGNRKEEKQLYLTNLRNAINRYSLIKSMFLPAKVR